MYAPFRDTIFGQIVRYLTKKKVFLYPEEEAGFELPAEWLALANAPPATDAPVAESHNTNLGADPATEKLAQDEVPASQRSSLEKTLSGHESPEKKETGTSTPANPETAGTNSDLETAKTHEDHNDLEQTVSKVIAPTKTKDGVILVDWYTTDDPDNPQNWKKGKKAVAMLVIYTYTVAVYLGSAIYTASEPVIVKKFGVSPLVASLGLSLYVLGYGTGPLLFSPLTEIPIIGRNPPYIISFGIFVILSVPTALVNNFAGLMVLRFLQGFFGSPCLATGGASIGDMAPLLKLSYFLAGWAGFATAGPALGPLISGFSVPAENWHWPFWEMLWLAGPIFIFMFFCLPETGAPTILLNRAKRLRALTGNPNYKAQSEIDQEKMTASSITFEALVRPWQINIFDPAVLFTTVYTALVYGIYYSFFEVFPIVYQKGYGFNLGQMGIVFLVITVAVGVAIPSYFLYLHYVFEPEIKAIGFSKPERRLIPSLFAAFLPPIGLFMFGWTGRPDIHWIVPTIGIWIYTVGVFLVFMCIFIYVPMIYPQYAASLFAMNDFSRSALAAGAILFASPLFANLGVGRGCSLLGGLSCMGILGVFYLYFQGPKMRAASKFTAKY